MPSESLAVAVMVILAGAVYVAPDDGLVSETDGGALAPAVGVDTVTLVNVEAAVAVVTRLDTARPT